MHPAEEQQDVLFVMCVCSATLCCQIAHSRMADDRLTKHMSVGQLLRKWSCAGHVGKSGTSQNGVVLSDIQHLDSFTLTIGLAKAFLVSSHVPSFV